MTSEVIIDGYIKMDDALIPVRVSDYVDEWQLEPATLAELQLAVDRFSAAITMFNAVFIDTYWRKENLSRRKRSERRSVTKR